MSAALTKVERVWLDGRELSYEQAGIPVDDPGIVRGDGVFEVVRLYGGTPLALEEHIARLRRSAAAMRQALDVEALRDDLALALADAPEDGDRVLRIIVTGAGRRL